MQKQIESIPSQATQQAQASIAKAPGQLIAKTKAVADLKSVEIQRMYQVFSQYYDHHSFPQFCLDLEEKNHVILLLDQKSKTIQGFSTLLQTQLSTSKGKCLGVYSGDTVVDKKYWGSGALGIEFLKYLFFLKLRNPFKPVYWFLISKGYKTYLIMANNFATHYPNYNKETPAHFSQLMQDFYSKKFAQKFCPQTGVIKASIDSCHLKTNVAEIDPELLKIPRIQFFQNKNQGWRSGDELCCIAEMELTLPFRYAFKKMWKRKSQFR
jgi:hypothetical protein